MNHPDQVNHKDSCRGARVRKYPVAWFYILAFGLSWLGWIPGALGSHGIAPFDAPYFQMLLILPAVGPALAAIVVTRVLYGSGRVKELLKALVQWRVGLIWYVVAVAGPVAILIAGRVITQLAGLSATQAEPKAASLPFVISAFVMSLFSNPWEEVGWRGFALPHLQKRYNALPATLIVGALWGLWHLPLFFWADNPMSEYPFLPWFIGTVAGAFIYTWLYNSTGGSILPVALFHVVLNTAGVLIPEASVLALAVVYCLVAAALAAIFGSKELSRRERIRME
jgi:membrane protease YdiL (CAAX protease family)